MHTQPTHLDAKLRKDQKGCACTIEQAWFLIALYAYLKAHHAHS